MAHVSTNQYSSVPAPFAINILQSRDQSDDSHWSSPSSLYKLYTTFELSFFRITPICASAIGSGYIIIVFTNTA